jgi:hypothetical protein
VSLMYTFALMEVPQRSGCGVQDCGTSYSSRGPMAAAHTCNAYTRRPCLRRMWSTSCMQTIGRRNDRGEVLHLADSLLQP